MSTVWDHIYSLKYFSVTLIRQVFYMIAWKRSLQKVIILKYIEFSSYCYKNLKFVDAWVYINYILVNELYIYFYKWKLEKKNLKIKTKILFTLSKEHSNFISVHVCLIIKVHFKNL